MELEYLDKKTVDFLDSIYIEDYAEFGHFQDIYKLIDTLEEAYEEELKNDEHFRGILFNWMTADEFQDYLHSRYPWWAFDERVQVTYLVMPKLRKEKNDD